MIEYDDITLNESYGFFDKIQEIMTKEGSLTWMIRSNVFVHNNYGTTNFLIHFWDNGKVVIKSTNKPLNEVSDYEDLKELNEWVRKHGWSGLYLDDLLLESPGDFQIWMRFYQSGVICSDILKKYDEDDIERFNQFTGDL